MCNYRIFNMHTWSFLYVHIYTWRLGTPTASQHIFDSEKVINFSFAPDRVRTSGLFYLKSNALPSEPPRHPEGWCYVPVTDLSISRRTKLWKASVPSFSESILNNRRYWHARGQTKEGISVVNIEIWMCWQNCRKTSVLSVHLLWNVSFQRDTHPYALSPPSPPFPPSSWLHEDSYASTYAIAFQVKSNLKGYEEMWQCGVVNQSYPETEKNMGLVLEKIDSFKAPGT